MISIGLARRLHSAGLRWEPAPGDTFVVNQPALLDKPFVLSDMVADVHDLPTGRVIGFNGTTEWALDSVEMHQALWLPGEAQLRERMGERFLRLERDGDGFRVVYRLRGEQAVEQGSEPAECYGTALLRLLTAGEVAAGGWSSPSGTARGPGGNGSGPGTARWN